MSTPLDPAALAPCPFCDGIPFLDDESQLWRHPLNDCRFLSNEVIASMINQEDQAAWNKRAHAPGGGTGWRPIDDGAMTGEDMLVCDARKSAEFLDVQCVGWFNNKEHPEYCWATGDGPNYHRDRFTHYIPVAELPAPPSTDERAK